MLPSDFFRRNVVLSFQEDAIGIRLRDVIGVDNMMWGSDYPHSESTFPQSRKILAEILAGVPDDEQAKPAPDHDPGIAGGNTARVYNFDVARVTVPARRHQKLRACTHKRTPPCSTRSVRDRPLVISITPRASASLSYFTAPASAPALATCAS